MVAVVFVGGGVGGLEILDADLLVSCGTMLVRNILVDLLALLLVNGGADVLALVLVVRLVVRATLLGVGGGAGLPVHVVRDSLTRGSDRGIAVLRSRKANCHCQQTKID